jgi:hypothetical protein
LTDNNDKKSWFEKNAKKTIFFILFVSVIIIVFGAEKYYSSRVATPVTMSKYWEKFIWREPEYGRYVRLMEFMPNIRHSAFPREVYVNERDGLEAKDYLFRTDSEGFIMPSKRFDDPDLVLAFLGGSTTECYYVDERKRFPALTGRLLGEKLNKKVNSYNCGRGGNNTLHSINVLINKVIPLKPDFVIMSHSISDLMTLVYEKSYWNDNPTRSALVSAYKSKNIYSLSEWLINARTVFVPNIYHFIEDAKETGARDEFAHIRGTSVNLNEKLAGKEFKLNLQMFVNICKARNITPVLATEASRLKMSPDDVVYAHLAGALKLNIRFVQIYSAALYFDNIIREVGRENDIPVIDLAKLIPKTNEYIYDAYHFSNAGSELAAEIITKELYNLIKASEKE